MEFAYHIDSRSRSVDNHRMPWPRLPLVGPSGCLLKFEDEEEEEEEDVERATLLCLVAEVANAFLRRLPWPRSPLWQYPDLVRTPITQMSHRQDPLSTDTYIGRSCYVRSAMVGRPGVLRTSSHAVRRLHYNTPSRLASHSTDTGAFRGWCSSVSLVTGMSTAGPSNVFRFSVWERNCWGLLRVHARSAVLKSPQGTENSFFEGKEAGAGRWPLIYH